MMYVKEASVLKIKPKPPLFKTSYNKKFNGKSWETDLSLNIYDFHARGYMPDIVRTFQQDPKAEKFYDLSPQSFLNNNPLSFIDPTGMEAIPPIGFDQEDGAQHTDKDGSWVYNKSTNVWEGKNGAQSYDNMITLSELTINMPDPYEGTYFDKDNKGSGIYAPYIPDAIGVSASIEFSGIFGKGSVGSGLAVDKNNNGAFVLSGGASLGLTYELPKISIGISLDFHDNYNGNIDVLQGLEGNDIGYSGGAYIIGGSYSNSAQKTKEGYVKANSGVESKSINIGLTSPSFNYNKEKSKVWKF